MKKYIYLYLVIALIVPNISFGSFLSDPTDLDLYKKIDKWYYDLELKYLDKELKGWDVNWSISDDLNKRSRLNELDECFSWDVSSKQLYDIYMDRDSNQILSTILKDCFSENWDISIEAINDYYKIIEESYIENSNKAISKVENIYKIWRIWMYSDWIEENSPFDLMVDLDEINSIIFEEEIPYNWVNNYDLWASVDGILSWLNPFDSFDLNRYYNKDDKQKNSGNTGLTNNLSWVCLDDNNNSWLSDDIFKDILWWNNWGWNNWNWLDLWLNNWTWWNLKTNYKKVNDNFWPCNNFFCILIDFVVYNHKLLWWGTNLSIEGLFKRSNEHFKKFASTSLIQSKMTTNNFEIWLKDLNLPDIFHVWVQVSYKPVPLLNVDKKEKNIDNDEYKVENLFTKYYANLWLDYKRANDLHLYAKKDAEIKSLLDSQELSYSIFWEKFEKFNNYSKEIKKQNDYISQTLIDKKVIWDDLEWFYKKYAELEIFTRALMEYTFWAKWIITEMNKIPQWW